MIRSRSILFTLTFVCTGAADAGPLTPPAGPIVPTGKTLTEVEPRIAINSANTPGDADSVFRITVSGSYYLAQNVAGQVGKIGIEVAAVDVTIDLNGFNVVGVAGSLDGIQWASGLSLHIHNGTVFGWGGHGIDGFGTNAPLIAHHVVSRSNQGSGIRGGASSIISECAALLNAGDGIFGGLGSRIVNCTSASNDGIGIFAGAWNVVTGCAVSDSASDGIRTTSGSLILNNSSLSNGAGSGDGAGIHVTTSDNRIEGNTVNGNDRGIDVDATSNLIIRNSASANTLNYVIVAGNAVGPVVAAPLSPAISGSTGASSVGSSDAWANISY